MSVLRLYNTLTRTKEAFTPLDPKNVRMYVCGPTVYDFAHIGNARPAIVFDVLFRLLRHLYGEKHVTYVRNVTDVDDKINARAAEVAEAKGIPIEEARAEITAATSQQYDDDISALGCLKPTHEPRATQYIPQMVGMIEALIAAGHAYASEGHVLYRVKSKPDYGKLAKRSLDEMIAGARVDVAPYKEDPMDFVLWKPSTPDLPGWDSPWGRGRPGWHIECSAMGDAILGETFDIHGGGIDLLFPHHENEIAQSEGAHAGQPPARVWMHNGFLQVEGEKMSKSLGNFVTIRELLRGWRGRIWTGASLRWAMLQTHYRDPIDWTFDGLLSAAAEIGSLAAACDVTTFGNRDGYEVLWNSPPEPSRDIIDALADDLNLPEAMKVVREQLSDISSGGDHSRRSLIQSMRFLGIFNLKTLRNHRISVSVGGKGGMPIELVDVIMPIVRRLQAYRANNDTELATAAAAELHALDAEVDDAHYGVYRVRYVGPITQGLVETLIEARSAARKAKNWKESDRIRDELLAKGIQLKDNPDGTTTWEVKR